MSQIMIEASIKQLIADVLSEATTPNPYDMINEIVDRVPEGEERAYLRDAVRSLLGTVSASTRRQSLHRVIGRIHDAQPARVEIQVDPLTLEEKRVPIISPKVQMIRDYWEEFMSRPLPLGGGSHVFMRDATVTDLHEAAETRRKRSEGLLREADVYDRIAGVLKASGKERLGELSPGDLASVRGEIEK